MEYKVITLSKRYEPPGTVPFSSIRLREPSYQDIIMSGLGFPQELQPNGQGGSMVVTYQSVIDDYAKRLIVEPEYKDISGLNFVDTKALQDGICSFFHVAARTDSPAPPTSSSSVSAGTQAPSSE